MPNESVERLPIEARIEFKPIRRKAKRWANDSFQELIKSKPEVPSIGNDRAEDNWGPLFAIAELIGEGWPEKVREAINHIESSSMNDEAIGPQLLSDIKMIFSESRVDRLFSEELVHKLTDIEESPWCEWKHGKPMTKNSLSRMLGPYNIKSKQIRIGYETKKGYELAQFEDSFARYLAPPVQSETTKQTSNDVGYSVSFQKQKTKQNTNETLQPSNGAGCFDVSLQTPEDVEVF
jgi:putative DNA primase/helicase